MKTPVRILTLIASLAFTVASSFAADTPPSDESIRELLQITNAQKVVEGMYPQIEAMIKASMEESLQGRPITDEQRSAIEKLRAKLMTTLRSELNWTELEPLYVDIYRRSFTQEEMDGMLAFYKTPAGLAIINKLPIVLQETMTAVQRRLVGLTQKLQAAAEEAAAELDASQKPQL